MKLTYNHLTRYPQVLQSLTGLSVREFERLLDDVLPLYATATTQRLKRADRQRAPGGGDKPDLGLTEQLLVTVIWLRKYPTMDVLGFLFGVSDVTVGRLLGRWVPVLETAGGDTMRWPDPGRKRRQSLDALLADTPELAVIVDTFEQRVQRPRQRAEADGYYNGKKKQHTLKSQIAVDDQSGWIVDVAASVRGPMHDMTVLKRSGLLERLPAGVGAIGDLAYNGLAGLLPDGMGASPRRKPNGKPRPPEDVIYNRAFASRRITVEHTIGRLRHYEALRQMDRQHRLGHTARVVAVAGLVNRQMTARLPKC
jgi:DDE superfamily endonuclease/Helix-turn-helix of DDE superfamily endonuclease